MVREIIFIKHSCPSVSLKVISAIKSAIKSDDLASQKYVRIFEEKLANYVGVKYAIAVSSGTSALHLCLLALGIGKEDKVILPSYTCTALLNAVRYTGAQPLLADIELNTYNLSITSAKDKLKEQPRAIILPYMFGYPTDINEFQKLGIKIIEDITMSLGAKISGKKLGSFGELSVASFYATKFITTGVGGAIFTNKKEYYELIKNILTYDKRDDYKIRYNYSISDIQAIIGISQLNDIENFIKKRREIAQEYNEHFSNIKDVFLPQIPDNFYPVYYRYLLRLNTGIERFSEFMNKNGIEVKRAVYKPLHSYLGLEDKLFPNTALTHKQAISIPIYPKLSNKKVKYIIKCVEDFFESDFFFKKRKRVSYE